ncbi:unnamed protein product [Coffea canephora]|uniref:Uncharacterized protein n=1 Tax=Coffea canephora TaxID=49390 RepID=A0A068U1I9_COFCA|nr:unnamed protein product [Coffea canephora]
MVAVTGVAALSMRWGERALSLGFAKLTTHLKNWRNPNSESAVFVCVGVGVCVSLLFLGGLSREADY